MTNNTGTIVVAGFALALALAAGCSAPVAPASPTWAEHVKPILAAKCVRCHGYPAIQDAPNTFRLDIYDDFVTRDGRTIYGARFMAPFSQIRTNPSQQSGLDGPVKPYEITLMPPDPISLTDEQQKTLFNWGNPANWESGPDGPQPVRGSAADNSTPVVALTRPLADSLNGELLVIQYDLRDPDGDIVAGELRVGDNATDGVRVGPLQLGSGEVEWDTGAMAVGTYGMFAVVDDGSGPHEIDLGTYEVTRTNPNIAPTITIVSPNHNAIIGDAVQPFAITVDIADPDTGDTLTISVEAFNDNMSLRLFNDEPAVAGTNTIDWNTTGVMEDDWQLRVTVSDGTVTRTAVSSRFSISHTTTAITYADVEPMFLGTCGQCHPGLGPDLIFTKILGRVYQRVIVQQNMPPKTFRLFDSGPQDPQLTDEDRTLLGEWILAGAPGAPQ